MHNILRDHISTLCLGCHNLEDGQGIIVSTTKLKTSFLVVKNIQSVMHKKKISFKSNLTFQLLNITQVSKVPV